MQTKMIACPHCGAENSDRKRICYQCQQEMVTVEAAPRDVSPARAPKTDSAAVVEVIPSIFPAPPQETAAIPKSTPAPKPASPPTATPPDEGPRKLLLSARLPQRAQMYRQLQNLLKAGIPIGLCLNYLENNLPPFMRPMILDMAQMVQKGARLSDAMARYYAIFPEWEVSMVQAAEKGGTLPEAMEEIARTLETEMMLRSQTWVKMMPLTATFLVFILTILIVTGVGAVTNGDVGAILAALGHAVLQLFLFCLAAGALYQAWRVWGRSRRGARVQQVIVSRLPLVGSILQNSMRLRFTRVLAALWRAGVSPIDALETAARASGNTDLQNRASDQVKRLSEGATLAAVLVDLRIFPQEAVYLVSSGETSGAIAEALDKVAEYLELQLTEQVRLLPMRAQLVFYAILAPAVGYFIIHFWMQYYGHMFDGLNGIEGQ